jgi:hypothetical protein
MNSRRRVNSDVGRLPLLTLILAATALVVYGQDEPRPGVFDPFDRWFGPISPDFERARLDNFAIALQQNPDWIGYILVHSDGRVQQIETRRHAETQRRANRMKRYVVCYRKIPWERVIATDEGAWRDESLVVMHLLPRAWLSKPSFEYYARLLKPAPISCTYKRRLQRSRRRIRAA